MLTPKEPHHVTGLYGNYWDDDEVLYDADVDHEYGPLIDLDDFVNQDHEGLYTTLQDGQYQPTPNMGSGAHHRHLQSPDYHERSAARPPLPEVLGQNDCLIRVRELFPDIDHDYVSKIRSDCGGIIQSVLDKIIEEETDYPRQPKTKGKEPATNRETSLEVDEKRFGKQDREVARGKMRKAL